MPGKIEALYLKRYLDPKGHDRYSGGHEQQRGRVKGEQWAVKDQQGPCDCKLNLTLDIL